MLLNLGRSTVKRVTSVHSESKMGKKGRNKEAHIRFCRLFPCLRLEDSASWSSLGCDLGRQKGESRKKSLPLQKHNGIGYNVTALEFNTLRTEMPAIDREHDFAFRARLKGVVCFFEKHVYSLCCRKLDEKIFKILIYKTEDS